VEQCDALSALGALYAVPPSLRTLAQQGKRYFEREE
jgi:hypothetical protein